MLLSQSHDRPAVSAKATVRSQRAAFQRPYLPRQPVLHEHAVPAPPPEMQSLCRVENFKDMRQCAIGFIDKTDFLVPFLHHPRNIAVLWFRRSGKTMIQSMAKDFFFIRHAHESHALFKDLNIARHYPEFYEAHRCRFPVINIDLK